MELLGRDLMLGILWCSWALVHFLAILYIDISRHGAFVEGYNVGNYQGV